MSQILLHHRLQSMRISAFAKAARAMRQSSLRSALSRWDGEGGAGPDGPQESHKPELPVAGDRPHEKPSMSFNPNGANS